MTDIFKFWSMIGKADTIHPLDRPVFARLNDSHGFDLRCLPAKFGGKLRTAPIVLLYLSPGFSETDVKIARSKEGQERYVKQRTGRLGFTDHHPEAARWRRERLAWLGEPEVIKDRSPSPTSGLTTRAPSPIIMFSPPFPPAGQCSTGRNQSCFHRQSGVSAWSSA
ncbi:hypothetical protein [Bradyrhizobium sp. 27S5]|uniref:hypothetical protein n=1 Tax=Bradyrhizobium sp. 27S5 TaxID=3139728 RepID=UPI0030CE5AD5